MVQIVPMIERKKLTASGTSVVITVPKNWLNENDLQAGDEILMVANGDLTFMKMTPENVMKIRNQLTHNPAGFPAKLQKESSLSVERENNT